MYLGSKLLPTEAPRNDEANETKYRPNDLPQGREGNNVGGGGRNVWRRKEVGSTSRGSTPLAQEGEESPHQLAARLIDTIKVRSTPINQAPTTYEMAETPGEDTTHKDPRKVAIMFPEELLANLRSKCDKKASLALLGRIQGKHPGLQALTTWAHDNLHPSLKQLSLQANNIFEVTFENPEGRIHALNQADLTCESAAIFFSSWRPHFDASVVQDTEKLDHPVWMQVVNLSQVLREDICLQTIGEQIGQVISIDNSEAYRAKLFGPRIRLLVKDLDALPISVLIPRLDREGTIEYALEFSGLPNQCGRCRSREHQVRFCPRKEFASRYKPAQRPPHQRQAQQDAPIPPRNTVEPLPPVEQETPGELLDENRESSQGRTQEDNQVFVIPPPSSSPAKIPESTDSGIPPVTDELTQADPERELPDSNSPKTLQTDDLNFPKLPSSAQKANHREEQMDPQQPISATEATHFVWRKTTIVDTPDHDTIRAGGGRERENR